MRFFFSLSSQALVRSVVVVAVGYVIIYSSTIVGCQADSKELKQPNNEDNGGDGSSYPDYIIVGAGASGVQMALLLEKSKRSYVVLEKNGLAGSFWTGFPRFGELISVNKWAVEDETQKMRYDWHSFLEAPLRMENVTEDYFPQGRDWQRYMAMVVEQAGLNIEYGVEVERITSRTTADDGGRNHQLPCVSVRGGAKTASLRCARHRVFAGTGLREKKEPLLRAMGGIPYSQVTKSMARRRRVCILGNGNSAFEVAENVLGVAESVKVMGRHPLRLSAVTRYTGDVRVKYLQILENFNGKLLDVVDDFGKQKESMLKKNVKELPSAYNLTLEQVDTVVETCLLAFFILSGRCQTVVIATGFESQVPGIELTSRFPPTKDWYESMDVPNVHYIGWLMHEGDFRMGAGGFFSGFRYLVRNLVHHVNEEDFGVPYPYDALTKEQVVERVLARFQSAHDLIILQDGVVIKDVVIKEGFYYKYFQGISHKFHKELQQRADAISFYFAWGNGRTVGNVFDNVWRHTDSNGIINNFLHPVVEVGNLTRHLIGSLDMTYKESMQTGSIEKVTRAALDGDLSLFTPKKSYPYKRTEINQTKPNFEWKVHDQAKNRQALDRHKQMTDNLWQACYELFTNRGPSKLTYTMRSIEPALFDFEDGLFDSPNNTES